VFRKLPASLVALAALFVLVVTSSVPSTVTSRVAEASATTCTPAPPAAGHIVTAMGDSLTTPYGASIPERAWPNMLKAQMEPQGWTVNLHGIGSTMAEQYLPGGPLFHVTETVRNSHPDIVTMDWRANEQLQGRTPAQLKTSLLALIDTIRQVSPDTQFLIINPPLMWYHEFQSAQAQDAYAVVMREVSQERGTCWLDLRPFFPQTGPDTYSRSLLFDDIHPGDYGHAIFFAAISTALVQACLS
jgi:lysophospholipase L1-like esterase